MAESLTPAAGDAGARRPPVFGALAAHVGARRAAWLVAGGLAVVVASAWFNRGFLSYDEHFQILEFAWYKLGRAPAETLAWEFREQMRPGLQPLMAVWAARGVEAIGVSSPFVLAFLLRLASGLLGVWVSLAVATRVLPEIRSERLKVVLVAGSMFLWFLPFAHVRFSADNWGGLLFFAGLCLLLDAVGEAGADARATWRWGGRPGPPGSVAAAAAAGLLWGFAFYFRYQIGFSIAGAGCWLLFVRRARPAVLAALALSFLVACAAGALADRWLYDAWVFTPYEYVRANLIEGKAAGFGVEPWWFYGGQMLLFLLPPFSVVLVGLLGAAAWYRPPARPGVDDAAVPGRPQPDCAQGSPLPGPDHLRGGAAAGPRCGPVRVRRLGHARALDPFARCPQRRAGVRRGEPRRPGRRDGEAVARNRGALPVVVGRERRSSRSRSTRRRTRPTGSSHSRSASTGRPTPR